MAFKLSMRSTKPVKMVDGAQCKRKSCFVKLEEAFAAELEAFKAAPCTGSTKSIKDDTPFVVLKTVVGNVLEEKEDNNTVDKVTAPVDKVTAPVDKVTARAESIVSPTERKNYMKTYFSGARAEGALTTIPTVRGVLLESPAAVQKYMARAESQISSSGKCIVC